jgi:hypothetical protein
MVRTYKNSFPQILGESLNIYSVRSKMSVAKVYLVQMSNHLCQSEVEFR